MNKQKRIFVFILTLTLLVTLYIALYIDDEFFRPYFGDLLVVILIYSAVKAVFTIKPHIMAISTLLFSFITEITQYFDLIGYLGLQDNYLAIITLGTAFSFTDLLMYLLGVGLIYIIDDKLIAKVN